MVTGHDFSTCGQGKDPALGDDEGEPKDSNSSCPYKFKIRMYDIDLVDPCAIGMLSGGCLEKLTVFWIVHTVRYKAFFLNSQSMPAAQEPLEMINGR